MKATLIASAMAAVAALLAPPVVEAETAQDAPRAAHVSYVPESPAAAFERMLAPRTPAAAAPLAHRTVDPLDAHFHAALWSDDASAARYAAAARVRTAKLR